MEASHHHATAGSPVGAPHAPDAEGGADWALTYAAAPRSEAVSKLLEDSAGLSRAERSDLISELLERSPAESRVEMLARSADRLQSWHQARLYEGVFDKVLAYADPSAVRRAMTSGFANMLSEEQEHVLAELMGKVRVDSYLPHRQATLPPAHSYPLLPTLPHSSPLLLTSTRVPRSPPK